MIVVHTQFLAALAETKPWEDHFDVLIGDLANEYENAFFWASPGSTEVDALFLLYPPGQHSRIVEHRVLEAYLKQKSMQVHTLCVIAVGRSPRGDKVLLDDVIDLVNDQCLGYKTLALRLHSPESLDSEVRHELVRLHMRSQRMQQSAVPQNASDTMDVETLDLVSQPLIGGDDL